MQFMNKGSKRMSSSITGRRLCGAVPYDCSGETTVYTAPTDTGNTVSRHFVQPAGSPVFSTNYALADMVFLWASCLDDLENFQPGVVVQTKSRPSWGHLGRGLPEFDAMPSPQAMQEMSE
jgi:hypothetical protein